MYPFLWKTKISLQGKSFPLQHQQFFKIKFLSFQTLTELCICKHSLHTKDVLSYYRNLHVSFLYTCTIYHKHPNVFVNIMCLSYCLLILNSVIYFVFCHLLSDFSNSSCRAFNDHRRILHLAYHLIMLEF